MLSVSVSPSRTYVAMCIEPNLDGHYFRKFVLPEELNEPKAKPMENDSSTATWFFRNFLNFTACVEGVMSWEDYGNIEDELTYTERWEAMSESRSLS